jgi:hypothetical protein
MFGSKDTTWLRIVGRTLLVQWMRSSFIMRFQPDYLTTISVLRGFNVLILYMSLSVGIESLLEVRTEVASVVAHSTDLGLALGLGQETTLHVLQQENQQDIARQFTEIIAAWLRGVDQAATPSWRSLTKALITPNVDCPLIARRIAESHPSGSSNSRSPVTSYSASELQFQNVDGSPLSELALFFSTQDMFIDKWLLFVYDNRSFSFYALQMAAPWAFWLISSWN